MSRSNIFVHIEQKWRLGCYFVNKLFSPLFSLVVVVYFDQMKQDDDLALVVVIYMGSIKLDNGLSLVVVIYVGQIKLSDDLEDLSTPRTFVLDREDLKLRPLPTARKNEDYLSSDAVRDQLKLIFGYLRRAIVSVFLIPYKTQHNNIIHMFIIFCYAIKTCSSCKLVILQQCKI